MTKTSTLACGLIVATLTGVAHATRAAGASQTSVPTPAQIDAILATRIDAEHRNVGIVVGISSPTGRQVFSRGRLILADPRQPDGETVFEIGSVTKVLTSTLLADMVRRGEVQLNDSIFTYLPSLAARTREARTITLADLATHTAGMPLWPSSIPATREGALAMATFTEAQLIDYLSGFQIPEDVGRKWSYSNMDAGVLGLALGRRAGTTYEGLLESRITGPLKMRSTKVTLPDDLRARAATGYDSTLKPAPEWRVPALPGAGSLHSTANDLLNFLDALANERAPLGGLLSIMTATRRAGPGIPQALAWWLLPDAETGILAHDGGTLGFTSAIAYDPKTRTGVVVLSNTASGVGDIARHILRPDMPLTQPAGAAPTKTELRIDPRELDRFVGRYQGQTGSTIEIMKAGESLQIQLQGIPRLRLLAEAPRRFYVPENSRITVAFEGSSDPVTSLTLTTPSGTVSATRVDDR